MKKLGRLLKGFEKAMAASAFAEEGEFEAAKELLAEPEVDVMQVRPKKVVSAGPTKGAPAHGGMRG